MNLSNKHFVFFWSCYDWDWATLDLWGPSDLIWFLFCYGLHHYNVYISQDVRAQESITNFRDLLYWSLLFRYFYTERELFNHLEGHFRVCNVEYGMDFLSKSIFNQILSFSRLNIDWCSQRPTIWANIFACLYATHYYKIINRTTFHIYSIMPSP